MKKLMLLTCLAAVFIVYKSDAQTPANDTPQRINPAPAAVAVQLDSLFQHLERQHLFNGNIAIAMNGQQIYQRSVGLANIKTNEPLTAPSPFELASLSKQFTAAGILLLVDKKKLALDQKVETIMPGFPYKGITVRMLLNHTSGLPDYMELFGEHWDSTKIAANKDILPLFKKYKPALLFTPGQEWKYSNTGYALLASIIEQVSKNTFAAYMHEEVFVPLQMNATFIYSRRLNPQTVPHYAFGYVADEQGQYHLPDETPGYSAVYYLDGIQGDGTVNTTTGDMLLWLNAVHSRKLLSRASWEAATTAAILPDKKSTRYGFGWITDYGPKSGRILDHTGSWPGYITYDALFSDRNIGIVLLANMEPKGTIFQETIDAVKKIVIGQPYTLPKLPVKKQEVTIDKSVYKSYTGTYNLAPDFDLVVSIESGDLFVQATGQGKLKIVPESATKFFVPDFPVSIEFKPAVNGLSPELTLFQNRQEMPARRK